MSTTNVTASVGEPTPPPKRPTLYLTMYQDDGRVWPGTLWHCKDKADAVIRTTPGAFVVTIPAEGTSGAGDKCKAPMCDCTSGVCPRDATPSSPPPTIANMMQAKLARLEEALVSICDGLQAEKNLQIAYGDMARDLLTAPTPHPAEGTSGAGTHTHTEDKR